jgi:hypothetical protein
LVAGILLRAQPVTGGKANRQRALCAARPGATSTASSAVPDSGFNIGQMKFREVGHRAEDFAMLGHSLVASRFCDRLRALRWPRAGYELRL